jgi:hypothetical protein
MSSGSGSALKPTQKYNNGKRRNIYTSLEDIGQNLLCLPVQVRMNESHVVVASDNIS